MTMFDVRYKYLFLDVYMIDIKGIIAFTHKKIFIQNTHQNIFVSIYLLKNSSYQKKTQISNSYHKLIWLSSYEKKKPYFKLLKLKKIYILISFT